MHIGLQEAAIGAVLVIVLVGVLLFRSKMNKNRDASSPR